ncbi:UbiA prenyltransferase family [Cristinia sonorae]|uniref:UbiA prenyltransferase family n=1 Tax=Cristinia sonorae TaxID=1940300 RepID=A0A8K0XLX0_9AGAR|nr:UbiA prenyltransferase family [Cristinia sonorae]
MSDILRHVKTLYLFTKSDIKTTVIPVTLFSLAAAPDLQVSFIPHTLFWVWLHLLQFDISNQTLCPDEDKENKKDRPLPSGRISLADAKILRWMMVPICWALSYLYSAQTLYASVALSFLTMVYNEFGAHAGHWVARNLSVAICYGSFELGATLVASADRNTLDNIAIASICISSGILATTYQAQDLKDIHGDRIAGRRTLPIVSPVIARLSISGGLILWSVGLALVWGLQLDALLLFLAPGMLTAFRFWALKTVREDQISFYWYNVWLSCVHALPGYYRHFYT